jgi:hypothetical protein
LSFGGGLRPAEQFTPPHHVVGRHILAQHPPHELELELIQTQMTQKPMLRAEVYARALRASQNRKEDSV